MVSGEGGLSGSCPPASRRRSQGRTGLQHRGAEGGVAALAAQARRHSGLPLRNRRTRKLRALQKVDGGFRLLPGTEFHTLVPPGVGLQRGGIP